MWSSFELASAEEVGGHRLRIQLKAQGLKPVVSLEGLALLHHRGAAAVAFLTSALGGLRRGEKEIHDSQQQHLHRRREHRTRLWRRIVTITAS